VDRQLQIRRPALKDKEPSDPKDLPIASDLDHEVKLLAERTGISPEEARDLIEETGSFADALKRLGEDPEINPKPT
jgi:NACalpha-BTF3-like transcription factor